MGVRLVITKRAKGMGQGKDWQIFDQESKTFPTMKKAKAFLKEQYGKASRDKMYIDTKSGKPLHIGYIYKFREKEWDRDKNAWDNYFEQDWVEFQQVTPIDLSKKKLKDVV
jgi:hypothetical protein